MVRGEALKQKTQQRTFGSAELKIKMLMSLAQKHTHKIEKGHENGWSFPYLLQHGILTEPADNLSFAVQLRRGGCSNAPRCHYGFLLVQGSVLRSWLRTETQVIRLLESYAGG